MPWNGIRKAMTTKRIENCNYCSPSGVKCSEAVQPGEKKCLWHNAPSSTESPLKEKIEEMVREDHSLAGFYLKKAELQDADLIYFISAQWYSQPLVSGISAQREQVKA